MEKLEVGRCKLPFCEQAQECMRVELSAWVDGAGGGAWPPFTREAQERKEVEFSAWVQRGGGGGGACSHSANRQRSAWRLNPVHGCTEKLKAPVSSQRSSSSNSKARGMIECACVSSLWSSWMESIRCVHSRAHRDMEQECRKGFWRR
eukprot:1160277-Pelagomonas_calceolata.AAC.10